MLSRRVAAWASLQASLGLSPPAPPAVDLARKEGRKGPFPPSLSLFSSLPSYSRISPSFWLLWLLAPLTVARSPSHTAAFPRSTAAGRGERGELCTAAVAAVVGGKYSDVIEAAVAVTRMQASK